MAEYLPPSQRHLLDFPPLGFSSSQVSVGNHRFGGFDEDLEKTSNYVNDEKLCISRSSGNECRRMTKHTNHTLGSVQDSSRSGSQTNGSIRGGRKHNQSWDGGRRRSTESSSRCRPVRTNRQSAVLTAADVEVSASRAPGVPFDSKWNRRNSVENRGSSNHGNAQRSQDGSSQGKDDFRRLKPMKLQFWKTKMCPWVVSHGHCRKESACRYAHSETELRPLPDLSKTKMCEAFVQTGKCSNPSQCKYAHSSEELRATTSFSKTKLCPLWLNGCCTSKETCRFAHGEQELRTTVIFVEVDLPAESEQLGNASTEKDHLQQVGVSQSNVGLDGEQPNTQQYPSVLPSTGRWEETTVNTVRPRKHCSQTLSSVGPDSSSTSNSHGPWSGSNRFPYFTGGYAVIDDPNRASANHAVEVRRIHAVRPPIQYGTTHVKPPAQGTPQVSVTFQQPSPRNVPTASSAVAVDTPAPLSPSMNYLPASASYPCFPILSSQPSTASLRSTAVPLISLSSAPALDSCNVDAQQCSSPPALSPMSLQFASNALVYLSEVQWSENQGASGEARPARPQGRTHQNSPPHPSLPQNRSRATSATATPLSYYRAPHAMGSPVRGFAAASREVGGVTPGQAGGQPGQLVFASPTHGGRMWAIQPSATLADSPVLLSPSVRPAAGDPNRFMAHLLPSGILSPISQASFRSSPSTPPFDLFVSFPSGSALDSVTTQQQVARETNSAAVDLPHVHKSPTGSMCAQPTNMAPVYVGAAPSSPHPNCMTSQRSYFQAPPGLPIMQLTPHAVTPWGTSLVGRVLSAADSSFVLPPSANCGATLNLESPDQFVQPMPLAQEIMPAQGSIPSNAIWTTLGLLAPHLSSQHLSTEADKQSTTSDAPALHGSDATPESVCEIGKQSQLDEDALAATEQPGSDASFNAMQSPDYSPSLFSSKSSSAFTSADSSPHQARKSS